MRSTYNFVVSALLVASLLAFTNITLQDSFHSTEKHKTKKIISCSRDWNYLNDWIEENEIPPIPGAGSYTWKISTNNDSAQFYFNQGINMYYSFHIIEAMASFKKATKFDPSCAMLYWAQALAYGPNINDLGYTASYDAFLAAGRAIESCGRCTEKEELLIRAQRSRYTGDSMENRKELNQAYVDRMKEAYQQFPNDPDVATLYADALMLRHPWDLWNVNGIPKPWTPEIREVIEKVLVQTPNHPGANHYYIHVMEASPYADKALPSADRLGKLTPGLSHTVHMPSHIYLREGKYNKGVAVNEEAINSYQRSIPLYAPVTGADFLYAIHNLHMKTTNAMMAGRYVYSAMAAKETVNSIPAEYLSIPGAMGNTVQYIYMTPLFVDIRFGKWDTLLSRTKPAPSQVYANLLYHFGRGIAFSHQGNFDNANNELGALRELMKDSVLYLPLTPFSAAIDGARVAENILLGVINERRNLYEEAIKYFTIADSLETSMVYNEPRDWLLNPKHYLGYVLLKAGRWEEARQVYLKDLDQNNENGWALLGYYQALLGQNKKDEAKKANERFKKAFDKADVKIPSSVF